MPSTRSLLRATPAALLAAAALAACGSRGPLDVVIVEEGPLEGGADVSVVEAAAGGGDASDAANTVEAGNDGGGPLNGFDGGPLFNCGSCIVQSCGQQFLTCITNTQCATALQCVFTTCLASLGSGGIPDPSCFATCANGDPTVTGQLSGAILCVVSSCGSQCAGAIGSLGGLGGGGGGGGTGGGSSSGGGGGGSDGG